MQISKSEDKLFKTLAVALARHPRFNLNELAKYSGISKATLYRLCNTREQLVEKIKNISFTNLQEMIEDADFNSQPPLDVLRFLIKKSIENSEYYIFLIYHYSTESNSGNDNDIFWNNFEKKFDEFFLNGQKTGAFRIDMSASALTDLFGYLLSGLMDSESRGRTTRATLAKDMEQLFLYGVAADHNVMS